MMAPPRSWRRRRAAQFALAGSAAGALAGLGIGAAHPDEVTPPGEVSLGVADGASRTATLDIEGTRVRAPADTALVDDGLDHAAAAADSPATQSPDTVSPASVSPDSPAVSPDTASPDTVSPASMSPETADVDDDDVDDSSGPGSGEADDSSGPGSGGDDDSSGSGSAGDGDEGSSGEG